MQNSASSPARVVCGVDDSARASAVLAVAAELAERFALPLQVVHAAQGDVFAVGDARAAALRAGDRLIDRLDPDGRADERLVGLGRPEDLLQAAVADGAALAVVGSRGRGPARAAVLGSVSRGLAASAPCPVVVVPPLARIWIGDTPVVLCGLDGFHEGDVPLWHAAGLAGALGGELVVVHVRGASPLRPVGSGWGPLAWAPDTGGAALRGVERAIAELEADIPVRLRIEAGDPAHALRVVADEERAGLVVVGSRGRGAVGAALLGSVSTRLAADAPAPVVVVSPTALAGAGTARPGLARARR